MSQTEPKQASSKLFVPSLVLSVFAAFISAPILTVLLTDITESFFGVATTPATGISAQLSTTASIGDVCYWNPRFALHLLQLPAVIF